MVLIDTFAKKKVDYFTVFASLPDMGRVGGLVSSFLASNLKAEHIANIISSPKPWVNVKDGVVESAKDVYKIYFSDSIGTFSMISNPYPSMPALFWGWFVISLNFRAPKSQNGARASRNFRNQFFHGN